VPAQQVRDVFAIPGLSFHEIILDEDLDHV
jgi:hypothetical protein